MWSAAYQIICWRIPAGHPKFTGNGKRGFCASIPEHCGFISNKRSKVRNFQFFERNLKKFAKKY
jgi:hypothetical protein